MSARRAFDHVMLATRIRHTGKLRRNLRPEERWVYVCVLAIAGEASPRGAFLLAGQEPTPGDMADEAAVPVSVARRALERIRDQGMLEQDDQGVWWVHDFDEHNPAPRSDPGNAERQRRYRERHASDNAPLRNGGNTDEEKGSEEKRSNTDSLRSSVLSAREAWTTLDANGKRVIEALVAVAEAKRAAKAFTVAQLISVCEKFADRDHVAEAEAFRLWWVDGVGENQPIKDLTATWRNWLKRAPSAEKRAARDNRRPVKPIPADDPLLAAFIETHGRPQS